MFKPNNKNHEFKIKGNVDTIVLGETKLVYCSKCGLVLEGIPQSYNDANGKFQTTYSSQEIGYCPESGSDPSIAKNKELVNAT